MKILDALLIGEDCGLETVGEAVYNVELRAISIFSYYELEEELRELHAGVEENNLSWGDGIKDAIQKLDGDKIKQKYC